jgi:hypothetical protein
MVLKLDLFSSPYLSQNNRNPEINPFMNQLRDFILLKSNYFLSCLFLSVKSYFCRSLRSIKVYRITYTYCY